MSYIGSIEGDIYSHCWFHESAQRALNADNFGDTCGGITVIALTAFMVESYLNLSCSLTFDCQSRIEDVKGGDPLNLIKKVDQVSKEFDLDERIAIAFGFRQQLDSLISELESVIFGKKKARFTVLCRTQSFYAIDDDIRFSPKAKFKALSEALYTDEEVKHTHQQLIERLFSLRNQLAHGRSEYVKTSLITTSSSLKTSFSPEMIPPLEANWQRECSLHKAHELFDLSCNLIELISKLAFNNDHPFRMPTQMAAVSLG